MLLNAVAATARVCGRGTSGRPLRGPSAGRRLPAPTAPKRAFRAGRPSRCVQHVTIHCEPSHAVGLAYQRTEDSIEFVVLPPLDAHAAKRAPSLGMLQRLAWRDRYQRAQRLEFEKVGIGERLERAAEIGIVAWNTRRVESLDVQLAIQEVRAPRPPIECPQLLREGVASILSQYEVASEQCPPLVRKIRERPHHERIRRLEHFRV